MITYPFLSQSKGLSLVELLVAMGLGLFLLSGVVAVMVNGKSQFVVEQEMAISQENARYILNEMGRDIRMAGYYGCPSGVPITSTLNLPPSNNWFLQTQGIVGLTRGGGDLPAGSPGAGNVTANTDVLIIRRGIPDDSTIVDAHLLGGASRIQITAGGDEAYSQGDVLAVASPDCDQVSIFQMTNASALPTDTPPRIEHQVGVPPNPGNCTAQLSGFEDCTNTAGAADYSFPLGSQLMRFSANAYFIADSAATGLPTLWRETFFYNEDPLVNALQPNAQELITGVEDMIITYGVDTDTDGIANIYQVAGAGGVANWSAVVSVNLTLILRSAVPVYSANTPVSLNLGVLQDPDDNDKSIVASDGTADFNDRFMRQKVSTTIRLRNRN